MEFRPTSEDNEDVNPKENTEHNETSEEVNGGENLEANSDHEPITPTNDKAAANYAAEENAEYDETINPEDGTNHNWNLNEATQHILKESGVGHKLDDYEGVLGYDTAFERKILMDKIVTAYRAEAENCDDATRQETAVEVSQLILGDLNKRMTLEEAKDAFGYSERLYHALKMAGVTHNDILYAADGGIYANFEISEENATMEKLRDICEVTGFDVTQVVYKQSLHDKIVADFADTLFNAEERSDEDVDGRLLYILKDALENRKKILGDEEAREKAVNENKANSDNTDNPGLQFEVEAAAAAYRKREETEIERKVKAYVDGIAESIPEEDEEFKAIMDGVHFLSDFHQTNMMKSITNPTEALQANEEFNQQMSALHEAIVENNGYVTAEGLEAPQLKEPIATLDQFYDFCEEVGPALKALRYAAEHPENPEDQALNDAIKAIVTDALRGMNEASDPIEERAKAKQSLDTMETRMQWEEVNRQAQIIAEYTKPAGKEDDNSLLEKVKEGAEELAKEGLKQAAFGAAAGVLVP